MNTLPNIQLVDRTFEGTVSLPVWKEFQSRQGAYGSLDSDQDSTGTFGIFIDGDSIEKNPIITNAHVNAYQYLTANSEQICHSILSALIVEYKQLQAHYDYDKQTANEIMPDIDNIEQFKNVIGLVEVHLMNVDKDNFAYVGYQFGCDWDEEHGLGIMTYKDRVIEIGGADSSFDYWVAKKDSEKQN